MAHLCSSHLLLAKLASIHQPPVQSLLQLQKSRLVRLCLPALARRVVTPIQEMSTEALRRRLRRLQLREMGVGQSLGAVILAQAKQAQASRATLPFLGHPARQYQSAGGVRHDMPLQSVRQSVSVTPCPCPWTSWA